LFPGFRLLRNHGVSLQNHTCSSIACVPSRATIMTGQYSALYRDKSYTDLVNTFLRRKALGVEAGFPPSEQS
jgi:arylsulfatase A-like enzyme